MHHDIIKEAAELIRENTGPVATDPPGAYCTLATIDETGCPKASTITAAKADGIRWIAFGTGLLSGKARRIEKCNRAGVCFNKGGTHNISLMGTIEIVTDPDVKREMWYDGLAQHFSGPDDPNYCVLLFKTERYDLFVGFKGASGAL